MIIVPDYNIYLDKFPERISSLRYLMGKSARDMSLSLGQNQSYVYNIESGKALPSMRVFIYICEYLGIEPKDFFDYQSEYPQELNEIIENLKKLSPEELKDIGAIIKHLVH